MEARSKRSTRLGFYFEHLLAYFFKFGPTPFKLLEHNYPLRNPATELTALGKQSTIGELDFVVGLEGKLQASTKHAFEEGKVDEDEKARLEPSSKINAEIYPLLHLEAALKFYLKLKNVPAFEPHNWLGPNAKDRLDIKLDHLEHHQLTMAKHYRQAQIDSSEFILKGRLFYHWQDIHLAEVPNTNVWCYEDEVSSFFAQDQKYWLLLDRSRWLGAEFVDTYQGSPSKLEISDQIQQHFKSERQKIEGEKTNKKLSQKIKPLMASSAQLCLKTKQLKGDYQRLFIVSSHWPN